MVRARASKIAALRVELLEVVPLVWRRLLVPDRWTLAILHEYAYAEFLQILGDRQHEQHEDMVRWIGGVFDPKGFDLNRINREWRGAQRRRR